jgi:hypothetical protein
MASSIFPTKDSGVFNPAWWETAGGGGSGISQQVADGRYLRFPIGQGSQTLPQDLTVVGTTKIGSGYLNSDNIIDTGKNNTFYGSRSSYGTGLYNCFFGYGSAIGLTTGQYNTAVGQLETLSSATTSSFATAIGNRALKSLTTSDKNTAIGYDAGSTLVTGLNNTFLGSDTTCPATGITRSTAVGSGAVITATNQIMLGTASETVVCPNTVTATGLITATGGLTTGGSSVLTSAGTTTLTGATTATGLITANGGISTPTVNFSYSTLPVPYDPTELGYSVSYAFPSGTNYNTGLRTFSLSLPVGIWQLFAYARFDTAQTSGNNHQFSVGGVRYALSFIPTNSLQNTDVISAVIGLTGTTSVDYTIDITVNTTLALSSGQTRFYAVRIA